MRMRGEKRTSLLWFVTLHSQPQIHAMEGLHTPSSSNRAPTSLSPPSAPLKVRLNSVLSRRSLVEAQLESNSSILKLNDSTMYTPLVDPQGFPRSDIDVAQVRTARVAIIRGRNDLKDLERELETLVREGLERKEGDVEEDKVMEEEEKEKEEELKPFAKVNSVAPNSPAQTAVRSQPLLSCMRLI